MNPEEISVFVVDDDVSVRTGLARLLRAGGFQVETFATATDLLARLPFDGVGCLILDVHMPELNGPGLHEQLLRDGCTLPVVFLTGHGDVPTSVEAMKKGAAEFLLKPVDDAVLIDAVIRAAVAHGHIREREQRTNAIQARMMTLTTRERKVMEQVIRGRLNKQIAGDLAIAEKTVKVHRGRVMEKLQVRSVAELVRLCNAVGIDPDPI